MKKIIVFMILVLVIQAQTLHIDNFTTDIFSSTFKGLKKVDMNLVIEGRYVEDESFKVIDALNVVVGSFYIENLATSQGKENLKKLLKEYSAKKHDVDIDNVYILSFRVEEGESAFSLDDLVKRLKDEGCCKKESAPLVKP